MLLNKAPQYPRTMRVLLLSLIACLTVVSCSRSKNDQNREDEVVQMDEAEIVGCWVLEIGPYLPAVELGADAQLVVPPTGLQFHAQPGGAWKARGFELSVPANATSGPLRTGFWRPVSRTEVKASLADPFTSLVFSLTLRKGRLEGHVEPRWDFGRRKQRAVVTGTKRSCPREAGWPASTRTRDAAHNRLASGPPMAYDTAEN